MEQVEYFSFGDEQIDDELDLSGPEGDSSGSAIALAERPEEPLASDDQSESAEKRAARPRGDSEKESSERRLPSSRRTRIVVALALGLFAFVLVRLAISVLSGGASEEQSQVATPKALPAAQARATSGARRRAAQIRASREGVERQRARRQRGQTRRRARRHRERIDRERRRRAKGRRAEEAAQAQAAAGPEVTAPEYVPPPYEPPPASESGSSTPGEGHLQDGSSSPEFGL